jgi:hypothetical protein
MPASFKKKFADLKSIRTAMNLDLNDHQKLVLIILSEFRRPGPNRYEIVDRRLRSGYGGATITLAEPDTSKKNITKMFGHTSTVKKPDEDVAEASQPETNDIIEPEKHMADAQHEESNRHEELPVQPIIEPEKHVADAPNEQSSHHEEPSVQPEVLPKEQLHQSVLCMHQPK